MSSNQVLRLTTAGSVDDGKSTLIGRLLYEAGAVLDDQLAALEKQRLAGLPVDLSRLTDGLKSEREQGITIDVAYKYFATERRKFILADAPGHVQFTRNMVTAASRADAAIILVDARRGVVEQTRRHSYLIHLLRVPHVVVAVNKMDLIDYDEAGFRAIAADFRSLSWNREHASLHFLPISALAGDGITSLSQPLAWYPGPHLLRLLESLPLPAAAAAPVRLPVQLILRSEDGGRFAAGRLTHGTLRRGDVLTVLPSGQESTVAQLLVHGKAAAVATAGQAVALRLSDELDLGRGDVLVAAERAALEAPTQQFCADLVWFDDAEWRPGERYLLKLATQEVRAEIDRLEERFDLVKLASEAASSLRMNDIASVVITSAKPLYARSYHEDKSSGAFVLIDPKSFRTVAAGMVR